MGALPSSVVGLLICFSLGMGCAAKQPPPALAEDPTASPSARGTQLPTCRWVPALPEEREDICEQRNEGAQLDIVERPDMRAESATEQRSTCVCD